MINKKQFEIIKSIADTGFIDFESCVTKHQSLMKDVYEVLQLLNRKKILIKTDNEGEYAIDNDKMISLIKPLLIKYHEKTMVDVYELADVIEVSHLDLIRRLMNNEKVLTNEERSQDQQSVINRMLRDDFIIKCQNQYILSLSTELSNLLIEQVISDESQNNGSSTKEKDLAELRYEEVLKRFKKS